MRGLPGQTTRQDARLITFFPRHGCMDDLITERSIGPQATWVIDVPGLFVDMFSTGVCTTGHMQTSGRLVQELDVRTVSAMFFSYRGY